MGEDRDILSSGFKHEMLVKLPKAIAAVALAF